ncbi:MAG: PAS domain-containing protein [Thalassobaculaceae bacterium]|nr:PAS domain-containing protein [Thalassobaculaceae bacterium]
MMRVEAQLTDQQVESRRASLTARPLVLRSSGLFLQYWLDISGRFILPKRDDVDPARIVPVLPHITIHQVDSDGQSIFKLAGTGHFEMAGKEITNSRYLDYVAPERRSEARERFRNLISRPCGLVCRLLYLSGANVEHQAESLGLPMIGRSGVVDTVFFVTEKLPEDRRRLSSKDGLTAVEAVDVAYLDLGAGIPAPTAP